MLHTQIFHNCFQNIIHHLFKDRYLLIHQKVIHQTILETYDSFDFISCYFNFYLDLVLSLFLFLNNLCESKNLEVASLYYLFIFSIDSVHFTVFQNFANLLEPII